MNMFVFAKTMKTMLLTQTTLTTILSY